MKYRLIQICHMTVLIQNQNNGYEEVIIARTPGANSVRKVDNMNFWIPTRMFALHNLSENEDRKLIDRSCEDTVEWR